jgi:2-polyprenyl-3-methyl-5-hydroxy-6-metoxy-1,4-benzoquinol methylase
MERLLSVTETEWQNLISSPMCPACGQYASRSEGVCFNQGRRGQRLWRQCLECYSYFDAGCYDEHQETVHAQHMPWGKIDTGKQLNEYKTRMFRSVLTLLHQHCPPPATLLDVGCSYGGFLVMARKSGYHVSGFDIVPQAVEYVHSQGIPAGLCFSIGDPSWQVNGALDVVSCLDVNCYWPDQRSELKYAFARLKPGGYLVMRVVDKSWMFWLGLAVHRMAAGIGKRVMRAAVNDHRFSMPVRSMLKLLQSCGFEVIYASPRGAVHGDQTHFAVKLAFVFGTLIWTISGRFVAPGALILARKPLI